MKEHALSQSLCQIRKKANATGTKSAVIGIGCLVTLPASGTVYQDKLCILCRYLKLPQITLTRDCYALFYKDKRILLKPDRFLESCPKLGFTLVACEQAKILGSSQLKPYPLYSQNPPPEMDFCSSKLQQGSQFGYAVNEHRVSSSNYSYFTFSSSSDTLKLSAGGPMFSTDTSQLLGISRSVQGSALPISAIVHHVSGFSEREGPHSILSHLSLLHTEELNLDKDRLRVSAYQALSKLAAKSMENLEILVSHEYFPVMLSVGDEGEEGSEGKKQPPLPPPAVLGACCKLLTIVTAAPNIFSWLDYGALVRYVVHAMNATQQATVHHFGGRILLNLLTNNPDKSSSTLHEVILAEGGRQTLRKLVRTHREDKHIQHTVSLILDLLLEQQCRALKSDSEERAAFVSQVERATSHLTDRGRATNANNGTSVHVLSPVTLVSPATDRSEIEVKLERQVEEQSKELKVQHSLLESKDTTIEQLHRQLEHTLSNSSDTGLEQENKSLREKLAKERERWSHTQHQLEQNMDSCYDLVKEMAAALRLMKAELGESQCAASMKQEYSSWNSVKDELTKMSRALSVLGASAEEELTYHYDMVDVGRNEAVQLQSNMDIAASMHEKDEVLRRFERTHSQSSLDLSVSSEEKATKTLDKLQMVRRAINELEQCLEVEEERLEKLRQKRFISPLQNIAEKAVPNKITDVDVHALPRGLHKHICKMLDTAPECAWRKIVPLLGMAHRIREIEESLDSPTAELIRIWTTENKLVTFTDLLEVLKLAEQTAVLNFIKKHLQLKKRLSKQSFLYYSMEGQSAPGNAGPANNG